MSKFICVRELPASINKNEHIIFAPNFLDEIHAARSASRSKLTTVNLLKQIVGNIANHYDTQLEFDVFAGIPYAQYDGIAIESNEQLSDLVVQMFKKHWPKMLDKYMNYHIQHRPVGTKLIWFNGPFEEAGAFARFGIEVVTQEEANQLLGKKEDVKKAKSKKKVEEVQATENEVESAE